MTDIEIFSAYLPYKVRCKYGYNQYEVIAINNAIVQCLVSIHSLRNNDVELVPTIGQVKLILKPLNTIDWVKCEFDMGDYFTDSMSRFIQGYLPERGLHILDAPYLLVQWLIKNHYDVFGAIEKGIAISE